ncbi:hypothetical protein Pelo_19455 [Pelomyxa schiedti]|nr:hypothetical protein Pelo_19455 [Pelomyxa schiedti]
MTLRHLIVSGLVKPSQSELECACSEICETHLLEWLIDELHIPLKKFTGWKALFRNKKDSAPVVEFMINKMGEVSEEILSHSIEDALSAGNFCVADWLEERYHRTKLGYERDLRHHTKLKNVAKYYFGSGALAWVLKHHNVPDLIGEDEVIKSVENCLLLDNFRGTLLLLNAFTIPHDNEKNIKANAMWNTTDGFSGSVHAVTSGRKFDNKIQHCAFIQSCEVAY